VLEPIQGGDAVFAADRVNEILGSILRVDLRANRRRAERLIVAGEQHRGCPLTGEEFLQQAFGPHPIVSQLALAGACATESVSSTVRRGPTHLRQTRGN
jgi:hypothetical protein